MKDINSYPIKDVQKQVLLEISLLTKIDFNIIPYPGDIDIALENYEFKTEITIWYEKNNIIGMYIYNSELSELPQNIGNLSYLKFLVLNKCFNLHSLPPSFENLSNLSLIIFYNDIEYDPCVNIDFPNIFQNLKLQKFEIDGAFNVYLPPSFVKLDNLKILSLKHCLFTTDYTKFKSYKAFEDPYSLEDSISTLPSNFGNLHSLKELIISNSRITYLPETLTELSSLKILNLKHSKKIINIEIIFKLYSIENLNLEYIKITNLPKEIGNFKNLKILNLTYNKLHEFPFEIRNCRELEIIYIQGNRFNDFNKLIENLLLLPKLRFLGISRGYKKKFPKELFDKRQVEVKFL